MDWFARTEATVALLISATSAAAALRAVRKSGPRVTVKLKILNKVAYRVRRPSWPAYLDVELKFVNSGSAPVDVTAIELRHTGRYGTGNDTSRSPEKWTVRLTQPGVPFTVDGFSTVSSNARVPTEVPDKRLRYISARAYSTLGTDKRARSPRVKLKETIFEALHERASN